MNCDGIEQMYQGLCVPSFSEFAVIIPVIDIARYFLSYLTVSYVLPSLVVQNVFILSNYWVFKNALNYYI